MAPPSPRQLRVAHLAPGHHASDPRILHKQARSLAGAGYDVTVLARARADAMVDGVKVVALPGWRSRTERFVAGPVRLWWRARRLRADVYHLHDVEAWPVGLWVAWRHGVVILDSHEDYPRLAMDRPWLPSRLRPVVSVLVRAVEGVVARRAAAVISAEHEGARRFPADRTTVVANYPLRAEFVAPGPPMREREPLAVYVGSLTTQRGAVDMVDAIGRLTRPPGARLELVGEIGEPGLRERLERSPGWARTTWRGPADRAGVRDALDRARVGLVLWHPTRKHAEGAVPVKLLEYLAAGLAVVAADYPAIRAIIEAAGAGVLVDVSDPEAVDEALAGLLADPDRAGELGERGRRHVLAHWTWEREVESLLAVYRDVAATHPPRPTR